MKFQRMKTRLDEVKRMQQLAGLKIENYSSFNEEENSEESQDSQEKKSSDTEKSEPPPSGAVAAAKQVFDLDAIKKQAAEKVKQKKLNEVLDPITWVAIILAVPALLQGLATLIEKATRKFKALSKEDIEKLKAHNIAVAKGEIEGHKKYASSFSKEVDEFAHWLHGMMVKPIEGVLYAISFVPFLGKPLRKEKTRHKVAEAIYLAVALGLGGWGLIHHAVGVTTAIDAAKLADVTVDTTSLANATGLVKNKDFILKLVA